MTTNKNNLEEPCVEILCNREAFWQQKNQKYSLVIQNVHQAPLAAPEFYEHWEGKG